MAIRVGFQKTGVTPEDHRLYASTAGVPAAALTGTSGLTSPGGNITATGAMTATIGAFRAVIQGTSNALQGAYPFVSDATTGNLTFGDGHATLPRIDLVYAQVRDNPYDSSGVQDGKIDIVAGTPNASPVAPPTPTSAIPLWEVRVNAGVNAGNGGINFGIYTTDRRTYVGWQQVTLGAYTTYTVVWTASAGTPSIGNGSLAGRYHRVGRMISGTIETGFGSTTTYGSAASQWRWSLPVPARVSTFDISVGSADGFRPGIANYIGHAKLSPSGQYLYITRDAAALAWGNQAGGPFPTAPTTNDVVTINYCYEAAA